MNVGTVHVPCYGRCTVRSMVAYGLLSSHWAKQQWAGRSPLHRHSETPPRLGQAPYATGIRATYDQRLMQWPTCEATASPTHPQYDTPYLKPKAGC